MLSGIILQYSKRTGLGKLARGGLQISRPRACEVAAIKARKRNDNKKTDCNACAGSGRDSSLAELRKSEWLRSAKKGNWLAHACPVFLKNFLQL